VGGARNRVSGEAVVSGRRSSRLTTGGARVDRVGAKLLPRAIAVGEVTQGPASPLPTTRPLTGGNSAGHLAKASGAIRSPECARKGATSGRKAAPAGDCGCGAAELGHSWSCSWIVSIAEVDRRCPASFVRARRARGARTLPGHPSREQRVVNGPRKPAPRGQARRTVTGSHPIPGMDCPASFTGRWISREHLPAEGVSGRRKQSPLTRRRWRRSSADAKRMAAPTVVRRACVTGGVRGRSCSDAAPENGASLRAPAGAPTRFPPRGGQRGNGQCARERPKLAPRRQAWVSRGRIVARRSGATRITASPTERAEVGGVAVAFTSCENYPLGSRTMTRMLVSNVGCRSWREAPSSFHRGPREGAEAGRG